jgi:2-isopropylmalate synthase
MRDEEHRVYTGRGVSADVLEASARAYVNIMNKIVYDEKTRKLD